MCDAHIHWCSSQPSKRKGSLTHSTARINLEEFTAWKDADHKVDIWSHACDVLLVIKFTEKRENYSFQGWGKGRMRSRCLQVQNPVLSEEEDCSTTWLDVKTLNSTPISHKRLNWFIGSDKCVVVQSRDRAGGQWMSAIYRKLLQHSVLIWKFTFKVGTRQEILERSGSYLNESLCCAPFRPGSSKDRGQVWTHAQSQKTNSQEPDCPRGSTAPNS